jgi:hypothetical protein
LGGDWTRNVNEWKTRFWGKKEGVSVREGGWELLIVTLFCFVVTLLFLYTIFFFSCVILFKLFIF